MRVLVVNAGSSTLKLRILGAHDKLEPDIEVDPWDGATTTDFGALLGGAAPVDAVGHRVVHGGTGLTEATVVTAELVDAIAALAPLAPLHQPAALAALAALAMARRALPGLAHVACFDTSFHTTLPAAARTYALPRVCFVGQPSHTSPPTLGSSPATSARAPSAPRRPPRWDSSAWLSTMPPTTPPKVTRTSPVAAPPCGPPSWSPARISRSPAAHAPWWGVGRRGRLLGEGFHHSVQIAELARFGSTSRVGRRRKCGGPSPFGDFRP